MSFGFPLGFTKSGVAGPFDPSQIPSLKLWFSADVGVYSDAGSTLATHGQSVVQWNDQSTNSDHLSQGVSAPTFVTGVQFGKPAVRVAISTTQYMKTADNTVSINTTVLSLFSVMSYTSSTGGYGRIFSLTEATNDYDNAASAAIVLRNASTEALMSYRNAPLNSTAVTYGAVKRVGVVFDGTNHILYVDNVPGTPASSTGTFTAAGTFGLSYFPGAAADRFDGDVFEIICYARALDSTERTNIDNWFKAKYGLS